MRNSRSPGFCRALVGVTSVVVSAVLVLAGCSSGPSSSSSGQILRIASIGNASFAQNFNPFSPSAMKITNRAVYESLIVTNLAKGEVVPWLAKDHRWGKDGKSLSFTLNDDLTWSDGEPLTAGDVVFTFGLARKVLGDATFDYVDSATASGKRTVTFAFNRPYTPGLYELCT